MVIIILSHPQFCLELFQLIQEILHELDRFYLDRLPNSSPLDPIPPPVTKYIKTTTIRRRYGSIHSSIFMFRLNLNIIAILDCFVYKPHELCIPGLRMNLIRPSIDSEPMLMVNDKTRFIFVNNLFGWEEEEKTHFSYDFTLEKKREQCNGRYFPPQVFPGRGFPM